MQVLPQPQANPGRAPLGKWTLVSLWWIAQTLFVLLTMPAGGILAGSVDGPAGRPFGIFSISEYMNVFTDGEYWIAAVCVCAGFIVLQLMMLLPVRRPRPRLKRGWPLWFAVGAAGLCGAVLAGAIVAAAISITMLVDKDELYSMLLTWLFLPTMIVGWLVATPLLHAFARRHLAAGHTHEFTLQRISALLFKGTLIEAALIIPLDIMIRRKTNCYSGTSTFWAMTMCIGVGLVSLGPAVLLPIFGRRNKPWFAQHCDACGYDMTGIAAAPGAQPRCPECGTGWRVG